MTGIYHVISKVHVVVKPCPLSNDQADHGPFFLLFHSNHHFTILLRSPISHLFFPLPAQVSYQNKKSYLPMSIYQPPPSPHEFKPHILLYSFDSPLQLQVFCFFFKSYNPISYASGREHSRSNLVDHQFLQSKLGDATIMDFTNKQ